MSGGRRRVLAGVVGLLMLGVVGAGCSGGSDSASRTTDRESPAGSASPPSPAPGSAGAGGAGAPSAGGAATAAAQAAAESTPGAGMAPIVLAASQQAKPGQTVTAAFQTRPGATCQLALSAGDGTQPPFEPQVADASGRVEWTWRLDPDTDRGSLKAWVSCSGGGSAQAELTVS